MLNYFSIIYAQRLLGFKSKLSLHEGNNYHLLHLKIQTRKKFPQLKFFVKFCLSDMSSIFYASQNVFLITQASEK